MRNREVIVIRVPGVWFGLGNSCNNSRRFMGDCGAQGCQPGSRAVGLPAKGRQFPGRPSALGVVLVCGSSTTSHHPVETDNNRAKSIGLSAQFLAGGRAFLGVGRGCLGDFFHLSDGLGYLLNAARLLLTSEVHFVHERLHFVGHFRDGPDRGRDLVEPRLTVIGFGDRLLDQR